MLVAQHITALLEAVEHHCECKVPSIDNPAPPKCAAHTLLDDQNILNHLAAVAADRERFVNGEKR